MRPLPTKTAPVTVAAPGVLINDSDPDGGVPTGTSLNYDGKLDQTADGIWQNISGMPGYDWALDASVVKNTSPTSAYPGISESFAFNGTAGGTMPSFEGLGVDKDPASFEIWFKPSDAVGNEVLFETGEKDGRFDCFER